MRDDTVYSGRQASRKGLRRYAEAQGIAIEVAHGVLTGCSSLKSDSNAMRALSMPRCRADMACRFRSKLQRANPIDRHGTVVSMQRQLRSYREYFENRESSGGRNIEAAVVVAIRQLPFCLDSPLQLALLKALGYVPLPYPRESFICIFLQMYSVVKFLAATPGLAIFVPGYAIGKARHDRTGRKMMPADQRMLMPSPVKSGR
jgi:hypothetical protein